MKETLSPNQREDNHKARALLATGCLEEAEGRVLEHSESEPMLASRVGNLTKYGEAQ